MTEVLCACADKLTPHQYVIDKISREEGYLCTQCSSFKPFEDDGDFDAMKHYQKTKDSQ